MNKKFEESKVKEAKEEILIMANMMGKSYGIKIDEIKLYKSEYKGMQLISAKVSQINIINISNLLLEKYIENKKVYEKVVKRILGHELTHIKYLDFKRPRKDLFKYWNCNPIKTSNCIHLLREIRADIEGRKLTDLTDEEYETAHILEQFNGEYKEIDEHDKSEYKSGYPSRAQRIYYGKIYKEMSDELIKELVEDYCKVIGIDFSKTFDEVYYDLKNNKW